MRDFFPVFIDLHDHRLRRASQRPPSLAFEDLLQFEVDGAEVLPHVVLTHGLVAQGALAGGGVVTLREPSLHFPQVVT